MIYPLDHYKDKNNNKDNDWRRKTVVSAVNMAFIKIIQNEADILISGPKFNY